MNIKVTATLFCILFQLMLTKNLYGNSKNTINNDSIQDNNKIIKQQKKFNTIKNLQSYDPETKIWSTIKKFNTIKILTESIPVLEEDILYENFWAYDSLKCKWYKINIPEYGYQLNNPQDSSKNIHWLKKIFSNLAIDLETGPGIVAYTNELLGFTLNQRAGEDIFYINSNTNSKKYKLCWFDNMVCEVDDQKSQKGTKVLTLKDPYFKNKGFSIPITLTMHYLFFNRLRLGGGVTGEINFIKTLYLIKDSKKYSKYSTKEKYFYNFKYFGLLGYEFFKKKSYKLIVDTRIGIVHNTNDDIEQYFKEKKIIRDTYLFHIGLVYERIFKKYFKYFTRLSCEYKGYEDIIEKKNIIKLSQPALYLQIGIGFNFGSK